MARARAAARPKPARPAQPRAADGTFTRRASAVAPGQDTSFKAASATDEVMAAWWPANTDPNTEWGWDQRTAVDRTRDMVANNPLASAAVDRRVAMTVGRAMRYSARHELMARRLGIDVEVASVLASQIEAAWENWSCDPLARCDWEGENDFGGLLNLAERHHYVDGEALAVMRWEEDAGQLGFGWRWRSSLQLLDPDRLSDPLGAGFDPKIVNGVESDGRRTVAYHIREAHPADPRAWGKQLRWERVPARTEWGRPIVLHLKTKTRAGQKRGISRFVAALRTFRQLDQYTDRELASAALNALFGATIKTTKTGGEVAEALNVEQLRNVNEVRRDFYKGVNPKLSNNARVAVLAPGDELDINAVPRHVASFQGFLQSTGRTLAVGLGLSGSSFLGDYTGMSFSTWRGEMLPVWRDVLDSRRTVETQFANLVLLCVIEEAIDNGDIEVPAGCPGLYENTAGWLAGRWIGPSRGTIDPEGEAKAADLRIAGGRSTIEDEALEANGSDYQANAGQVAFERDLWKANGLTPTAIATLEGQPKPGAAAPIEDKPQPENVGAGNVAEPPPPKESQPGDTNKTED